MDQNMKLGAQIMQFVVCLWPCRNPHIATNLYYACQLRIRIVLMCSDSKSEENCENVSN